MKTQKHILRRQDSLNLMNKGAEIRLVLIDGEEYRGRYIGWSGAKLLIQSFNRSKIMEVNPIFIDECYEAMS